MRMATKYGFFSTVADRNQEGRVVVRARARRDLENPCDVPSEDDEALAVTA